MKNPKIKMIGDPLPTIPWEEQPDGCTEVMWRYSKNPIIPRNLTNTSNSIFNSAVIPYNGKFAGVFRCDNKERLMNIYRGFSDDGIKWKIDDEPIEWICEDEDIKPFIHRYDPRVVKIEDNYYITWCNGYHGPTIGMGYTSDFNTFYQMENAFLPFNRNGVLFPRKINGKYYMLSRPSDNGHTPFGDIFISASPDMLHWGYHRHVMGTIPWTWASTKLGAGPIPIETSEGWLLLYHGVLTSCNGFVYSFSSALLDIEKPWKVLYRAKPYLVSPQNPYECIGDVPNVTFPCACLIDPPTGRIATYYGCADTVTGLTFSYIDELIEFTIKNSYLCRT